MKDWIKALWVPLVFIGMVAVCYNIADKKLSEIENVRR